MKRGFTLIEMLVAMTITIWILAVTLGQFFLQRRHLNMQEIQVKLDRNTRLALMSIGSEMRDIGLDPRNSHSFGITAGNLNSITYFVDRNQDGVVDATDAGDIHLNGSDLVFNGNTILSDVTGLTFTYYDNAGNAIVVPPPINEDDGFGYFTSAVALFQVTLSTQINSPQGRILGISNQTAQFERKNQ